MSLDIRKILRKVKPGNNAVSLLILIVFSYAIWYMIDDIKIVNEDIPDYVELTINPYKKFENLVQKTKLQEVINGGQFKELEYGDNLIKEYENKKEGSLFLKKF